MTYKSLLIVIVTLMFSFSCKKETECEDGQSYVSYDCGCVGLKNSTKMSLEGFVLDSLMKPIQNCKVTCVQGNEGADCSTGSVIDTLRTDADGKFYFAEVHNEGGIASLEFSAEGYSFLRVAGTFVNETKYNLETE